MPEQSSALDEFGEYFGDDARDVMERVLDEHRSNRSDHDPGSSDPSGTDDAILDAILDGDNQRAASYARHHKPHQQEGAVG